MSDFVRKSDVIQILKECNLDETLFEKDVFDKINNLPTAYDMGKVVEALQENSYVEVADDMDAFGDIEHKVVRLDNAIEIVKQGGVVINKY